MRSQQMYSLAYGTIPVVSRRGGLVDTVEEVDIRKGSGTGFFFVALTPHGYCGDHEADL